MEQQELEGGLEVLEADLSETENSVYHLVRSNVEIAQFLKEAPGDEDLEQALEENKLVLVKKRHRIKALRNAISDLKLQRPHMADAAAAELNSSAAETSDGVGTGSGSSRSGSGIGGTLSTMTASLNLNAPPASSPPASEAAGGAAVSVSVSSSVPNSSPSSAENAGGSGRGSGGQEPEGVLL